MSVKMLLGMETAIEYELIHQELSYFRAAAASQYAEAEDKKNYIEELEKRLEM
jgi:hypothetical protein